jgi:hypothetical protein
MKKLLLVPLAAMAFAAGALAVEKAAAGDPAKPAPMEMKATGTPGKVVGGRTQTITATVKAVDVANRTLTLQGPKGEPQTFKVGEKVKRLGEIAAGDQIVVKYEQGLLLEWQMPGEPPVAPAGEAVAARAGAGEPPGATAAAGIQATVTITAIDMANRMVVFKGPMGNLYQVKAGPKVQLDRAKVGDQFLATYVETVAVSVEKAKKAAPKKAAPEKKKAEPAK